MARFNCRHPYKDFYGYKVFHSTEGRWFVQLVHKKSGKRTTKSLARYRMEVSLGHVLNKKSK